MTLVEIFSLTTNHHSFLNETFNGRNVTILAADIWTDGTISSTNSYSGTYQIGGLIRPVRRHSDDGGIIEEFCFAKLHYPLIFCGSAFFGVLPYTKALGLSEFIRLIARESGHPYIISPVYSLY